MAAVPQYSDEQRNFLNNAYIKRKGRKGFFRVICDEFEAAFPGVRRPQASTIRKIHKKQNTHFTVKNLNSQSSPGPSHSGRKKSVRTDANIAAVSNLVMGDHVKEAGDVVNSSRRNQLGISKSSFDRIIRQDLKFHCYVVHYCHALQPGDREERLQFAQEYMSHCVS